MGRNISTKSVYGDRREDVTGHYKYPEGQLEGALMDSEAGTLLLISSVLCISVLVMDQQLLHRLQEGEGSVREGGTLGHGVDQ